MSIFKNNITNNIGTRYQEKNFKITNNTSKNLLLRVDNYNITTHYFYGMGLISLSSAESYKLINFNPQNLLLISIGILSDDNIVDTFCLEMPVFFDLSITDDFVPFKRITLKHFQEWDININNNNNGDENFTGMLVYGNKFKVSGNVVNNTSKYIVCSIGIYNETNADSYSIGWIHLPPGYKFPITNYFASIIFTVSVGSSDDINVDIIKTLCHDIPFSGNLIFNDKNIPYVELSYQHFHHSNDNDNDNDN